MVSTIPNFAFLTHDASPSYVAVPSRFTRAAAHNSVLLQQCGPCVRACVRAWARRFIPARSIHGHRHGRASTMGGHAIRPWRSVKGYPLLRSRGTQRCSTGDQRDECRGEGY
jgi:hypothetical protein